MKPKDRAKWQRVRERGRARVVLSLGVWWAFAMFAADLLWRAVPDGIYVTWQQITSRLVICLLGGLAVGFLNWHFMERAFLSPAQEEPEG